MKYLVPIFLLTALSPLKSQQVSLKGYVGFAHEPRYTLLENLNPNYITVQQRGRLTAAAMPAIAFKINRKSFFELGFKWSNSAQKGIYSVVREPSSDSIQGVTLGDTKYKALQVQLEYNHSLSKNPDKTWQAYLGVALDVFRTKFDFHSNESYIYSVGANNTGAKIGVVPRLQFQWTKSLAIDLNMVLFAFSGERNQETSAKPGFPSSYTIFEFKYAGGYWLRAGLAWKIGGKKPSEDSNSK